MKNDLAIGNKAYKCGGILYQKRHFTKMTNSTNSKQDYSDLQKQNIENELKKIYPFSCIVSLKFHSKVGLFCKSKNVARQRPCPGGYRRVGFPTLLGFIQRNVGLQAHRYRVSGRMGDCSRRFDERNEFGFQAE